MQFFIKYKVKNRNHLINHCFITALSLIFILSPISVGILKGETAPTKNEIPIDIKSERMVSDNKKDMVSFTGNVVAVRDKMTTYADKMDVYTEGTSHRMKMIISTGRVKIIVIDKEDPNKKWVGKGDEAIYEKESNQLTLIGNASVTDEKNIIKGDRIIYNIDQESMVSYGKENKRTETIIFETK
ncbi:MAG: lipopolysaccharide transport periplasmic protein LptA [Nitrospinota bacterium]